MAQVPSLEEMFRSSNHGTIALDQSGVVQFVNPKAKKVLDFAKGKLLGSKIVDVLPITGQKVMDCIQTGRSQHGTPVVGKHVTLILDVGVIWRGDSIVGAVCNFIVKEELETLAQKLGYYSFSDGKFRKAFETSSDGIWICSGDGKVLDVNIATEKLGGIHKEDIIGMKVSDLIDKHFMYDSFVTDEVIRSKRPISKLCKGLVTNKMVLCTGLPVLDENNNVSLVVINERDISQLHAVQQQLEELEIEKDRYKDELTELSLQELKTGTFIAKDKKIRQVIKTAFKLARMGVSDILLLGESGTGKGLLAKFIHKNSMRAKMPFIQINCAALPESILEAELFGYEKGAFTGAKDVGKPGLLEMANEGTLFLDEIGEMPISVQAKFLKYLDDHEIMRLGGTRTKKIDCTIIAATNRDLDKLVSDKEFRSDLYYRLSSLVIEIPPLRDRPGDIYELTNNFLQNFNSKYGLQKTIHPLTVGMLESHRFPGNVRELRNIIKKAFFMSDGDSIDLMLIKTIGREVLEDWSSIINGDSQINSFTDLINAFEKELLRNALVHCKSTREMARYLNISQPTVVRKMKKHRLSILS